MMILFKKIRYKNIFAFGNAWTEWELNTHPTTLFLGKNGSGKSTAISDVLSFVLYNRAHREIVKATIPNSINGKKCVVELEFSIGTKEYKVIRGMKPNIFEIWCNGVLQDEKSLGGKPQDFLETEILRMNFKSFCQIVILGKASFIPFMRLAAADRRNFIENVLDIQIFTQMNVVLKAKAKNLDTEMSQLQSSLQIIDVKISASQRMLEELSKSNDARITELRREIEKNNELSAEYSKQAHALKLEIDDQMTTVTGQDKLNQKFQQLRDFQTQINQNSVRVKTDLSFFEQNDNCPTCTQIIDPAMKAEKVQSGQTKLAEYDRGLDALRIQVADVTTKLSAIRNILNDIAAKNGNLSQLNGNIRLHESHVSRAQAEINKLQIPTAANGNEQATLDAAIDQKTKFLDTRGAQLTQKQYYDVALLLLKDTGIRTRVIKKYLPVMNTLLNKYLKEMDFFVNFQIDENFEETIKSRFRDEFKYNNFSEGQKLRIDLALLFTFREIAKLRNGMDTNLLVFDETFDSSLDDEGVDDLLKIIASQTHLNIFVISHRSRSLADLFSRAFEFTLKNEFTHIKELT